MVVSGLLMAESVNVEGSGGHWLIFVDVPGNNIG